MSLPEDAIQSIMSTAEQRERLARRRAFLYALIPIVLAGLLVLFTGSQIRNLARVQTELTASEKKLAGVNTRLTQSAQEVTQSQQELVQLKSTLERTQSEYQQALSQLEATRKELDLANTALKEAQQKVDELQKRVDELTQKLEGLSDQFYQASTFKRFEVDITEEQVKDLPRPLPEVQQFLLFDILSMRHQGIRFNPTGASVDRGFDSPNFAVFMLQQRGLLPDGYDFAKLPWEQLPQASGPENGDLVYYKSGYTMFYFNSPVEFVVGMTPVGILTLRPDFASVLGYLKINYRVR